MRSLWSGLSTFVLCLAVVGAAPAAAQEEETYSARPTARPMEIFGCMLREGKTAADVQSFVDKFNGWMDETGQNDYFAYVLWPHYRSRDHEADFLWVGGWPTGATMGGSIERFLTEGGEVMAEVDRVATCPYSANFATFYLSTENPSDGGPVRFTNCKVAEGHDYPEVFGAILGWLEFEKERGSTAQHFVMFPSYGESRDADYDFKWVTSSSWKEFGEGWDRFSNAGGWQKSRETFDGLLECDTARLYSSMRARGLEHGEE